MFSTGASTDATFSENPSGIWAVKGGLTGSRFMAADTSITSSPQEDPLLLLAGRAVVGTDTIATLLSVTYSIALGKALADSFGLQVGRNVPRSHSTATAWMPTRAKGGISRPGHEWGELL